MRTLPPAAVRRQTVRDMLIKHLSAGEDINMASEECIVRATAKLAHIAYRKVRARHVQWLYPMFGAVDEENFPGEIWFASCADDVFNYVGGLPYRVTVGVGRHAMIEAFSIGHRDYWTVDSLICYEDAATLSNRVRRIKQFVLENAYFEDDEMHSLSGVPKATEKELKRWARKALGPMPTGLVGPRRPILDLLNEETVGNGEWP